MNDLVLIRHHEECIGQTRECLKIEFNMVDSEILQYFLGIEVWQTLVGIVMSQQIYVVEIMKTFGMIDNKSNNTLYPKKTFHRWLKYTQIVGSLILLCNWCGESI